jgi:hypothetical protein
MRNNIVSFAARFAKLLILPLIFLLCVTGLQAQQVTTQWVINNFTGYPIGVMIGLDNSGNVIVTGHAGDNSKIITTKYSPQGNLIWQRNFSIPDVGVNATWLSVDQSGNIIVTGFPRTYSSNPVETGLLTLKYDNNGNLLWSNLIPGTWAFALRSVVDQNGNIYVTGRAWQYTATYDFVTVKYSPGGTQLWFDTFDQNSGFHTPNNMTLDQNGNLYITGAGQSGGVITVRYDNAGVRQWVREKPGIAGHSIKTDAGGNVYVTGSLWNNSTNDDIMLLKYDVAGNLVWEKYYDFGNFEYGRIINFDSNGNIIITGNGSLPNQFKGWLTVKLNPSGNLLWYKRFKLNQSWEENPYFAIVGPDNEIYITGNVGVTSGGSTYNGLETIRYNPDGSTPWTANVDLYAGIGKGLVLAADKSLYAVGMYYYSVLKYGQSNFTGIGENTSEKPREFNLHQNYPNPFNPVTMISYGIPDEADVSLKVYDVTGREIENLVSAKQAPGKYSVTFNGQNYTSGVYFYRFRAVSKENSFSETKQMILIK